MDFRPALMHYHMYPGGVSTLILNTIFLLVEKGYIKDEIQFVLGSEEKSEWFFDALKKGLKNDIKIKLDIIRKFSTGTIPWAR
ncbi:MAG: hypothetical protein GDA56_21980 [Hormoscilla sp. GM7CHS1pb]|nr:hypothetical protein [Hormoscilla sp. GM7CHS1pb]